METKGRRFNEPDRSSSEMVPAYKLRATKAVLAEREAELRELKGQCSTRECRLHYAHRGPCDIRKKEG